MKNANPLSEGLSDIRTIRGYETTNHDMIRDYKYTEDEDARENDNFNSDHKKRKIKGPHESPMTVSRYGERCTSTYTLTNVLRILCKAIIVSKHSHCCRSPGMYRQMSLSDTPIRIGMVRPRRQKRS